MTVSGLLAALMPRFRDTPMPDRQARIAAFQRMVSAPLPSDYLSFLASNGHAMFFPDNRVATRAAGGEPGNVTLHMLDGVDDLRTTLACLGWFRPWLRRQPCCAACPGRGR